MGENRKTIRRELCDALIGPWDGTPDWDGLVSASDEEGVAALLYRRLEQRGWLGRLPDPAERRLRRLYFASAANNLLILGELGRILDALGGEEPKLSAVVLKGADLALTVYPGMALRPMCDLDLLVRRQALEEAVERIRRLGFREVSPEVASGHRQLTGHALCLLGGPHDSVSVEMHWGLIAGDRDWRSPDLEWFWGQTEEWIEERPSAVSEHRPGGRPVTLPSSFLHLKPEAHVLYLAAHLLFQHSRSQPRLIWLYDLHLLVCRYGSRMDWGAILERAREFRWMLPLRDALRGAHDCFGTPVPHDFLEKLAGVDDQRAHQLLRHTAVAAPRRGERVWKELRCLPWPARWRFVWNHFFPSPAYLSWRYKPSPKWLWPLCYPYRWGVILAEGLLVLARSAGRMAFRMGEENP